MNKVTIEIPKGKIARQKEVNGETIIELVDDDRSVIERVKTFSDALREVGIKASEEEWEKFYSNLEDDVVAYMKLRIIAKALNEGWEPKFDKDECRYYPTFIEFRAKTELKRPSDIIREMWANSCVVFDKFCVSHADMKFDTLGVSSNISNRLVFKTRELAEYAAFRFFDIFGTYISD